MFWLGCEKNEIVTCCTVDVAHCVSRLQMCDALQSGLIEQGGLYPPNHTVQNVLLIESSIWKALWICNQVQLKSILGVILFLRADGLMAGSVFVCVFGCLISFCHHD